MTSWWCHQSDTCRALIGQYTIRASFSSQLLFTKQKDMAPLLTLPLNLPAIIITDVIKIKILGLLGILYSLAQYLISRQQYLSGLRYIWICRTSYNTVFLFSYEASGRWPMHVSSLALFLLQLEPPYNLSAALVAFALS